MPHSSSAQQQQSPENVSFISPRSSRYPLECSPSSSPVISSSTGLSPRYNNDHDVFPPPSDSPPSLHPSPDDCHSRSSSSLFFSTSNPFIFTTKKGNTLEDIDVKLMERFYHWPFFAIALIHIRLLFFQLTHEYFDVGSIPMSNMNEDSYNNERMYLITFMVLTIVSFLTLLLSHCVPKTHFQSFLTNITPTSISTTSCNNLITFARMIDNIAAIVITFCLSSLIILLTVHTRESHSYFSYHHNHSTRDGKQTHLGCAIHSEFMFHVMMMPFLLQCKNIQASSIVLYSCWLFSCISTTLSLALTTLPDHTMFVLPFAVSLIVVSLVVLVYHRERRVKEYQFYLQFEELKEKYNELTTLLESKQQEIITQRHVFANSAHDMKMPIISTITGCELVQSCLTDVLTAGNHQSDSMFHCGKENIRSILSSSSMDINEHNDPMVAAQQTLTDIVNANKFMLISVQRCMEYAKVADGMKLVPKYETCQLQESIRTVFHCLASTSDKNKVNIVSIPTSICSHVLTDKQWFQENVLCLLSNAVKFTPTGKKVDLRLNLINIATSAISSASSNVASPVKSTRSSTSSTTSMILVEVEDRGIGISKEMQMKLFAPFQQAQKHAGGTGLGLYSLAMRMEALGGSFGVRDRLDGQQGSLFWFSFPYKPDTITETMLRYERVAVTVQSTSDSMISKVMQGLTKPSVVVPLIPSSVVSGGENGLSWSTPSSPTGSFISTSSRTGVTEARGVSCQSISAMIDDTCLNVPSSSPGTTCLKRPSYTSTTSSIGKPLTIIENSPSSGNIGFRVNAIMPADEETCRDSASETGVQRLKENSQEQMKYRILLADDSSSNRKLLTQILRHRGGHNVISASNGLETIEKLNMNHEQDNWEFDVIILDLHMPVMDGYEAMRRIREQEATLSRHHRRRQFIIGCSANDDEETIEETLAAGADAFLPKPFTLEQFLECMRLSNSSAISTMA